MADGRKHNKGTLGNNGGRPSKAEELKAIEYGIEAVIEAYGSVGKYWKNIAEQSKDSFPHLKLLQEYIYGKAKETKDISIESINSKSDTISRLMQIPEERFNEVYNSQINE